MEYSNTFSIIPGALGKEDQLFMGDIDVDLECGIDTACSIPNLMDGIGDRRLNIQSQLIVHHSYLIMISDKRRTILMTHASDAQIDNLVSLLDGYDSQGRTSPECKCIYRRNSAGRTGCIRKTIPADRSCIRLCSKL